jgi:regulatory protein
MADDQIKSDIRNSALAALSRRDHSRFELKEKLSRKYPHPDLIELCLNWLQGLDYLDDQRFAGMFVRNRVAKRRGPRRINLEMQHKGLASQLCDQALEECGADWFELAVECLSARFKSAVADQKDRAKRYRYLQGQGFMGDQIQHALDRDTMV